MYKIAIVVFRESLEIALLLGIILAATKTINNSRIYVILGSLIGMVLAAIFALLTKFVTVSYGGLGDEMFDAVVIVLTAAIISWTVVWMQGYTKKIHQDLNKLTNNINAGLTSHCIIVAVVATAILREGAEIILFVYSISSIGKISVNEYIAGLGIGILSGLSVGIIIYRGLIKYAGRYIFKITTILLTLIAAGLASEAAGILTSSGIIEVCSDQLWDTSWLVSNQSMLGKLLNIIVGYDSKPNGMQIIFYISTILITTLMMQLREMLSFKQKIQEQK
ncbi:MAG: hypothetical protein EKK61_04725 [Rickettsiales bacterium]|nr:MAG: hypothetical protein EKK61_04725 [Rickettsiales bacterium]